MSQKRLFFAADDKLLAVLTEPLRKAGLAVEIFRSQADVVPATKVDPPDILLLGAKLPDGTALATFEALSGLKLSPPPTVVVLAQSQLSARAGLLRAGIADVAVSPIRPRQLAARLAELAGAVRRAEVRESVNLVGTILVGTRVLKATTIDLSREGLGVRVSETVAPQALITVTFDVPNGAPMALPARVLHVHTDTDGTFVLGVRLLGLAGDEENALAKLAQESAAKTAKTVHAPMSVPPPTRSAVPAVPVRDEVAAATAAVSAAAPTAKTEVTPAPPPAPPESSTPASPPAAAPLGAETAETTAPADATPPATASPPAAPAATADAPPVPPSEPDATAAPAASTAPIAPATDTPAAAEPGLSPTTAAPVAPPAAQAAPVPPPSGGVAGLFDDAPRVVQWPEAIPPADVAITALISALANSRRPATETPELAPDSLDATATALVRSLSYFERAALETDPADRTPVASAPTPAGPPAPATSSPPAASAAPVDPPPAATTEPPPSVDAKPAEVAGAPAESTPAAADTTTRDPATTPTPAPPPDATPPSTPAPPASATKASPDAADPKKLRPDAVITPLLRTLLGHRLRVAHVTRDGDRLLASLAGEKDKPEQERASFVPLQARVDALAKELNDAVSAMKPFVDRALVTGQVALLKELSGVQNGGSRAVSELQNVARRSRGGDSPAAGGAPIDTSDEGSVTAPSSRPTGATTAVRTEEKTHRPPRKGLPSWVLPLIIVLVVISGATNFLWHNGDPAPKRTAVALAGVESIGELGGVQVMTVGDTFLGPGSATVPEIVTFLRSQGLDRVQLQRVDGRLLGTLDLNEGRLVITPPPSPAAATPDGQPPALPTILGLDGRPIPLVPPPPAPPANAPDASPSAPSPADDLDLDMPAVPAKPATVPGKPAPAPGGVPSTTPVPVKAPAGPVTSPAPAPPAKPGVAPAPAGTVAPPVKPALVPGAPVRPAPLNAVGPKVPPAAPASPAKPVVVAPKPAVPGAAVPGATPPPAAAPKPVAPTTPAPTPPAAPSTVVP